MAERRGGGRCERAALVLPWLLHAVHCGVDSSGTTRLAYGSVGPRALLLVDDSGVLADPARTAEEKAPRLAEMFVDASPSPTSMRAGPEYRVAMLPVLGARALQRAIDRLEAAS